MSFPDNGGYVYPLVKDGSSLVGEWGMSLRDYFAANAAPLDTDYTVEYLCGQLGWDVPDHATAAWYRAANAAWKYAEADAMIAERNKEVML